MSSFANTNVHAVIIIGSPYFLKIIYWHLAYTIVHVLFIVTFIFSCSFDCFKKHKTTECAPVEPTSANDPSTENAESKRTYHFTTEDTVDLEKLDKLGK